MIQFWVNYCFKYTQSACGNTCSAHQNSLCRQRMWQTDNREFQSIHHHGGTIIELSTSVGFLPWKSYIIQGFTGLILENSTTNNNSNNNTIVSKTYLVHCSTLLPLMIEMEWQRQYRDIKIAPILS